MNTKKLKCVASALKIRSLPVVEAGTDLGKKVIKGQIVSAVGESLDGKWYYVDAPAARGWASADYLELAPTGVSTHGAWPKVPTGYDEIVRIFGEPGKPICSAGRVKLPAPLKVSWSNEKVTEVACHKLLEDVFESVFQQIFDAGLWGELENFGGIYSNRDIRGSDHPSTHSWGISGDFDTADNPLGSTDRTAMHPRIVSIFEDHGFMWGGDFKGRKDPMHFQYARGY